MDRKCIFITRPEHEYGVYYLSKWQEEIVLPEAQSKGLKIVDFKGKRANIKSVSTFLTKQNPELVVLNGHGNEYVVTGHNDETIISEDNCSLLKGKITFAISCQSAKGLGREAVKKGARAYAGYDDDFIFYSNDNYYSHPLKDPIAKLFLTPPMRFIVELLKGKTIAESNKISKDMIIHNMRSLANSESTNEQSSILRALFSNYKHQIVHGDQQQTL